MKKKILLINPFWHTKGGIWKGVSSCFPPIGLLSIAAVLEKAGHDVMVFDENVSEESLEDLYTEYYNPDIVGITITTATANSGYEVANKCRFELWPLCKIIIGGVHANVEPEEVAKHCDTVIVGEGEEIINEVINKDLHGIVGGTPVDVSKLPMPAYHLVDLSKYKPAVGAYRQLPAMLVVSSRGCPNFPACTYCFQPFGGKVRQKSPESLMKEITYLSKHGIKEIAFYDDNFTTIKPNLLKFCKLLKEYQQKEKKKITWSCFARVDWLDEEKIVAMKEAGCHTVLFGIESGNTHIREDICHKHLNIEKAFAINKLLKKHKIETRASFIFGFPEDTVQTMNETIQTAINLDPDVASFNILCPNPGTEVYDLGVKNGWLKPGMWDSFDLATVVLKIPTATEEEILRAYKDAHRKFYLRPKYIWRRLLKSFTPTGFINNWNGLKAVLKVS